MIIEIKLKRVISFFTSFYDRNQKNMKRFILLTGICLFITSCNKTNFTEENPEWVGLWVSCYNCDSVRYSAVLAILESGDANWNYENYLTGQKTQKKGRFKIQNGNELYIGRQKFTINQTWFDSANVYPHAFTLDTIYFSRSVL